MKKLGLVLALVAMVGSSAVAATQNASYDVYAGWNLICAPLVPTDSDPYTVFAGAPYGIDYMLSTADPSTGGVPFEGDVQAFGGILLGQGYWLNCYDQGGKIEFTGVPDGVGQVDGQGNVIPSTMTDMWLSLPGNQNDGKDEGGWHLIGNPFNHSVFVNKIVNGEESYLGDNILFTDGTSVRTWDEAVYGTPGWVDYKVTGNNAQGGFDVQYDGGGFTTTLDPACGYWIRTYKDNLAMIIPAN